jgi:excisionase family DNA binding protein
MLSREVCMASCFTAHSGDAFTPQLGRSVSIEQAAHLLGVSRRTIYNHIKAGRLATVRTLGGSQRILVASLPQPATRAADQWPQDPALA